MNLENELNTYARNHSPVPEEKHIEETIKKSIITFNRQEENAKLSYSEFFFIQLKVIQKRWWLLQALLLWGMWELLFLSNASNDMQRGMSIAAALFVVLIIPELWKNRESESMEIEAASYYSLKQVYAVRLISFGLIDVFMLTIFCALTTVTQAITIEDLLKQLVFPMIVIAAICFVILGSKNKFNEIVAIAGCLIASGIWTVIVMNEKIYTAITPAMWGGMFAVVMIALIISVRNVLHNCNCDWEVKLDGIEIE